VDLPAIVDSSGQPINGVLTITPSFPLKWDATDQLVLDEPIATNIVGGTASVSLPIVQSGFVLTSNVRVDGWTYTASLSLPAGNTDVPDLVFLLPAGTDNYSLDFNAPNAVPPGVITNIEFDGEQGPPGPANSLTIGSVTNGDPGSAAATITGTPPSQILNLVIPQGLQGTPGSPGSAVGVPVGGTTNQILKKNSGADYDTGWIDVPKELPAGGATAQILSKNSGTDYDVEWVDAPVGGGGTGLPVGGFTGQVLTKNSTTDGDAIWASPVPPVVSLASIPSLTRFETTPGVYPARGTARTDLRITFVGTVAPPIAPAGGGTNFVTSGTAMDNIDAFFLRVP
jgi:hypothetical protein